MRRLYPLTILFLALLAGPAISRQAPPDHTFTTEEANPGESFSPNRKNVAVYDPAVKSNGELLVFLPGTGTPPIEHDRVLRSAVEDGGFHSLGLDWVNGFDMSSRGTNIFGPCGNDATCFADVRLEALDGIDHSPKVVIDQKNGILNRLVLALTYLDHTYPTEGWGAFLSGGQPVWSKIAIAGHSNGSGEAAFIASRYQVARVALFSGPIEAAGDAAPFTAASWLTAPLATPISLWYAFASTRDNKLPLDRIDRDLVAWSALGLDPSGNPTVIDNVAPPFGGAHALITKIAPCAGCDAHNMTAGQKTPMNAGVAVFRPVWDYMLGSAQ